MSPDYDYDDYDYEEPFTNQQGGANEMINQPLPTPLRPELIALFDACPAALSSIREQEPDLATICDTAHRLLVLFAATCDIDGLVDIPETTWSRLLNLNPDDIYEALDLLAAENLAYGPLGDHTAMLSIPEELWTRPVIQELLA